MRKSVKIIKDPHPDQFGHSVKDFLCALHGPTWIDFSGQDESRTRVLVTLLHGNEPSGVKAIFSYIRDRMRKKPLTNFSVLICSVEAALQEPEFSHRYLADAPDMNRCFRPPFDTENGKVAQAVLKRIRTLKPEAVVDIHNTSGSGPDFTISSYAEKQHTELAQNFSARFIVTKLTLGSLMEAEVGCPVITLECGGSFDLSADQTALNAVACLTSQPDLFDHDNNPDTVNYCHPLRFEIRDDVSLCYGEEPAEHSDVTLEEGIEKHNFGTTPADDFLGWVGPMGLDYFTAINDEGMDIKNDLFKIEDGKLFTKVDLRLFMVTPRVEIAKKDCLFYLVRAD